MNDALAERLWAEIEAAGPDWVVFDVGRVLVEWEPDRVYADLFPDPEARAAFFERVGLHEMNLKGDRGELTPAVEEWAARYPEDAEPIRAWRARWAEMFTPAIPETAEVLRRAKAGGRKVAALTNFAADTWLVGQGTHPVLREFDVEVVSGRLGALKPEAEIYAAAEAATGARGAQLWFLDDKVENVAAARARGWGGRVFDAAYRSA